MIWNGTHIIPAGIWKSANANQKFACTSSDLGTCAPSNLLVVSENMIIVPGTVSSVFNVSYSCGDPGYEVVSEPIFSCEDIDECEAGTSLCNVSMRACQNNIGGYFCGDCPSGFSNDGLYECMDIDECAEGKDLCSKNPARMCMNTWGSYTCGDCPVTYTNDGLYNCTKDAEVSNPCTDNTHLCKPPRNCSFSTGSAVCLNCPTGYKNNGPYECTDADECTEGTHKCSIQRSCSNIEGGYQCANCPSGLYNNGPYECSTVPITVFTDGTVLPTETPTGSNTNTPSVSTTSANSAISTLVICLQLVVVMLFI